MPPCCLLLKAWLLHSRRPLCSLFVLALQGGTETNLDVLYLKKFCSLRNEINPAAFLMTCLQVGDFKETPEVNVLRGLWSFPPPPPSHTPTPPHLSFSVVAGVIQKRRLILHFSNKPFSEKWQRMIFIIFIIP